jgi:hypothetical protein
MGDAMRLNTVSLHLLSILSIAMLVGGTAVFADTLTYTFTTEPSSGNIEGAPGSTIGWGYSITNESATDWLVTANLAADVFADSTPDASPFDFPIIAPLTTVSVPYDLLTDSGLFALTLDADAPVGFVNDGTFTLSAQWWTGDPLTTGSFLEDASDETAVYSATVSSPTSAVPEPQACLLLPSAMLAVLVIRKRVGTSL